MTSTRPALAATALIAAALALAGCDRDAREAPATGTAADASTQAPQVSTTGTILTLARRDADFTTLVSAIQTAEMEEALSGPGPFTVFAPTNVAFEKIPAERRDALTTPEGRSELRQLLTYHVVPARLDAATLMQRIEAAGGSLALTTMQGGVLTARVNPDGSIGLTDATGGVSKVVESDLVAPNGVIHAIDTVAAPG